MKTEIEVLEEIDMENPILVEGLPGIGNSGRIAAGYLISELEMQEFARLYSPHMLPLVVLYEDAVAHTLTCTFYHKKINGKDLIIVTGDSQSISSEGHYHICDKIMNFAKKLGVKEVITLGGYVQQSESEGPGVIGAVSDKKLVDKYKNDSFSFEEEHPVGTIVGASGILIGLAKKYGIDGLCLMGKTTGAPLIIDPRAADNILKALKDILEIDIDLKKLEETAKEIEEKIKKTEKVQKQLSKTGNRGDETMKYIG